MTYHRQTLHIYSFFPFFHFRRVSNPQIWSCLSLPGNPGDLVCSAELSRLRTQPASEDLGSCACLLTVPCLTGRGGHPLDYSTTTGDRGGQSSPPRQGSVRRRKVLQKYNSNSQHCLPALVLSTPLVLITTNATNIPFYRWGN